MPLCVEENEAVGRRSESQEVLNEVDGGFRGVQGVRLFASCFVTCIIVCIWCCLMLLDNVVN
mgnify:FL=1